MPEIMQTGFGNLDMKPVTFSTGSTGWRVYGKLVVEGRKCQFSGNLVVIGSKPNKPLKKQEKKV